MLSVTENMPWDWPAEVNALEANAYCRWFSQKHGNAFRLMTEDEYNLILQTSTRN